MTTRFVGLDWATQPKHRARVELVPRGDGLAVARIDAGLDDDAALEALGERATVTGVDTPFGWPAEFLRYVGDFALTAPGAPPSGPDFSLRLTDRVLKQETGKQPLSISTDRIALCTLSWLRVAAAADVQGRIEVGQGVARHAIIETYPGAALQVWGKALSLPDVRAFKRARKARRALLPLLARAFEVHLTPSQLDALVGDDDDRSDTADAWLAALNAAAFAGAITGWSVRRPSAQELPLAQREGWMFFPVRSPQPARP